jgi:HSP20 family protein
MKEWVRLMDHSSRPEVIFFLFFPTYPPVLAFLLGLNHPFFTKKEVIMSLIRWRKDDDFFPSLSSFFDDFFDRDLMSRVATGTTVPAVNISEEDDRFEVQVAAPGLRKEDFKVNLDRNMLTISAEHQDERTDGNGNGNNNGGKKMTRREFSYSSFQRSFTLPDNVDADNIRASYQDGLLTLTLPKREEAKRQEKREISIS